MNRSGRQPRYATDRADPGRSVDCERMMVYFMYPHDPYVLADLELQPRYDAALKSGTASRDEVWDAHLDNFRFVLDEVAVLL